jgi:hypothetical protein
MLIKLLRYGHNFDSSGGALITDGVFHCHIAEDEPREIKVPGETRIPAGNYEIKLRDTGNMHDRYQLTYPWHRGMLWLQDVPNFEWIYIHPGNVESQTDGCILCGYTAFSRNGFALGRAEAAYKDLCLKVYAAFDRGEQVHINIVDLDK